MGRPRSTGRRAVAGLVLTAVFSFAVVGTAAYVVAHVIARADALSEGLRTARGVGRAVFAPEIPAAAAGDQSASAALDAAVAARHDDGTLLRAKVWRRDGTVLWSDDHSLIGRRFPLSAPVAAVFDQGRDHAEITRVSAADAAVDSGPSTDLVEAYVPLTLRDGDVVTLEMFSSDARVRAAEDELSERLVTFALVALLVLALAQLPVSIWLVRRTVAAQHDRERMLDTVLLSSERERRLIAGHLHDNLVQELAGAAYLLDSRSPQGVPADTRHAMGVVTQTLYDAVDDLRDMLVELRPDELTSANLGDLIATAAVRACPDQKVSVTAELDRPLPPEIAAFLYRCARECAVNVAKHAHATSLDITLTSSAEAVRLVVRDNGTGIPDPLPPAKGHVGLALLRDAATDLGGSLDLRTEDGAVVTIQLPPS